MKRKSMLLFLVLCLSIAVSAALFVVMDFACDVAYAQDASASFDIAVDKDGRWSLYKNDALIFECDGAFIDPGNQNAVSVQMYSRIKSELQADGVYKEGSLLADVCDISFSFPAVDAQARQSVCTYTETSEGGIEVYADYDVIVSTPSVVLEYRRLGEKDFVEAPYVMRNGALVFGKGVDVGQYEVRYALCESFYFEENRQYNVIRYSNVVECAVEKADLPMPSVGEIEIVYGETDFSEKLISALSDNTVFVKDGGSFVVKADESSMPKVRYDEDGKPLAQTVVFDYIPGSGNYNELHDVAVRVIVSPRKIDVRICDAYSLVGEPLYPVENVAYVIDEGQLAFGDDKAALGITLYYGNIDVNVPSNDYKIFAKCSNPNYYVANHSFNSKLARWGRYTVYEKKAVVTSSDGITFEIYCGGGFIDFAYVNVVLLDIEELDVSVAGKTLVRAYEIIFTDYDGNELSSALSYSVSWQGQIEGASWVATECDEQRLLSLADVNGVTLAGGKNVLWFFGDNPVEESAFVWSADIIAMLCVCIALLIGVLASAIALKRQRGYLR